MGALVPSVKSEPAPSDAAGEVSATATEPQPPLPAPPPETADAVETADAELDKDFLCPICMQIIKDAFLTSCGHSFCYMCIVTHLQNKSDCPCCGRYLTANHLFPNFLLNKVNFPKTELFCEFV